MGDSENNRFFLCVHIGSMMRIGVGSTLTIRPSIGEWIVPFPKANPEMWVQLGEETQNKNDALFEIFQ